MRLESLELRRIGMPLVAPFETSFGVQTERDILLIRATTSEGDGWGECVAGEEPTYSPEYVEGAQQVIVQHLAPRLFARDHLAAADVAAILRPVHGHQMAKACLEMAVLDAELRARGESFAQCFGARLAQSPLHTTKRLLLRAIGVLQFLGQQFADFRLHGDSFA